MGNPFTIELIKLIREHLSTKIFIITVCLLITVGGAIYGMVALGMSRSYFLELDRSLSNQTEKMVLQLSNTSVQEIDGILKMFALEHGISIVLKDSDEKVLGIYGDMEYSLAPGTDVEDILLGSGITESYSCKLTNGKTYWIQVFGNKEKVNIGLESLKRILPMLGAITFLAALAIAALYTKYITRSILKVSEVSKKMANLDFRVRYTEDRRDEIGILGENLNELSEKLESALDELKEKNTDLEKSIKLEQQLEQQQMAFFSAVSHELKTPITILKGQIQGMLLEVGGYKDRDRYLKRSFEVANSMENMVQEILYVSKIRTSGFELKLIDIPLHQLVENVIKEQEDSHADDKENSADDSEVLANADLRGAVLEFSDTGCNISIGTQTDDAEMVPAPGAVVEEMNQVKIVYGENTYFQISHSTMTGITLEDCRKEEVKKQSMLYLYGDYQEDGTFLAKRVIIDRFEKEGEWE